jgi:hypothetical protein
MEIVLLTVLVIISLIQLIFSFIMIKFGLKLADHLKENTANIELLRTSVERLLDRRGLVEVSQNWENQPWQ